MDERKLQKLKWIMQVANQDVPSTKEVANLLTSLIKSVKTSLAEHKGSISSDMKECMSMCETMQGSIEEVRTMMSSGDKKVQAEVYKMLSNEVYKLEKLISEIKPYDPALLEDKWSVVIHELHAKLDAIKPYELKAEEVRDSLESLSDEERLDITAIKGWDKTIADLKKSGKNIQLVGGGTSGIQLSVDSVLKGISKYVNLVAGEGIILTPTVVGESAVVTISAVSGGGSETPTGDVDGVNTVFTFTRAPKVIIVDQGRTFILNNGFTVDGTGLVATVDVAPEFSIFSI
jgi:hypothetical protein